jgi:hypothetical protein
MTTVTTQNPVRSDLATAQAGATGSTTSPSRLWAVAGIGAALAGVGTIVTSSAVDVVYRDEFAGTTDGVAQALSDKSPVLFAFHSITTLGAVLMIVFGAGLFRRLRAGMPDSIAPLVALIGLAGTGVVSVLGSGLDTEFMMPGTGSEPGYSDSSAALYNHWVGTIPWLWTLAGLAGLALFVAMRAGAVTRWTGVVGLVLGGLTVGLGVSPLEYLSGVTGVLWLLVTALGFALGDRAYREASPSAR